MFDVKFHENRLFKKIITSNIKVSPFYVVFNDLLFVKIR
jgi:ssDNA-specific exonuclease RecJ